MHLHRAHEAVVVRPQRPRETGEPAGENEGQVLVQPDIIAERAHPPLGFADPLQREPERRADHDEEQGEGDEEDRHAQVMEGERARERKAEERRTRDPGDAVVAHGQAHPAEGEAPHHHPEGERDHEEIDACRADGDEAEHRRDRGGGEDRRAHARPEGGLVARGEDGHDVGRDAEVGGVPERGETGVTEQQIEAHREDGEDEDLGEEGERVGRQEGRQGEEQRRARGERDRPARAHRLPKSPVGRRARMSAMGAKSVK